MTDAPQILVVDDEPKICSLLKRLLEREGYCVDAAGDGDAALRQMVRARPDLLITDLKMPGMDGMELVRSARSIDPQLPAVLVTGYASLETAIQALREGVEDYITKPFSIAELKNVVGRILQSRALEAENVRLVRELKVANDELEQHRERLTRKLQDKESDLGAAHQIIERRLMEMEVLHEINRMTKSVIDQDDLIYLGAKLVQDKVGFDAVTILLLDADEDQLIVRGVRGPEGGLAVGDSLPLEGTAAGRVLRAGESLLTRADDPGDVLSDEERKTLGRGPVLVTPMRGKELLSGVIMVSRGGGGEPLGSQERDFLLLIAHDLATALENARLFDENERAYIDVLSALVEAMEARDPYLRQHSERVCAQALRLGRAINLSDRQMDLLQTGARLHDLGKVGIEDEILHKPGSLDDSEMDAMRSHSTIGDRIVKPLGRLGAVKPIIRHHHERWDGTGYPDGLRGEEIPLLAQIVSLADVFDAMTSRRSYRDALPPAEAQQIIREGAGTQFNPFLVDILLDVVRNGADALPPGAEA